MAVGQRVQARSDRELGQQSTATEREGVDRQENRKTEIKAAEADHPKEHSRTGPFCRRLLSPAKVISSEACVYRLNMVCADGPAAL